MWRALLRSRPLTPRDSSPPPPAPPRCCCRARCWRRQSRPHRGPRRRAAWRSRWRGQRAGCRQGPLAGPGQGVGGGGGQGIQGLDVRRPPFSCCQPATLQPPGSLPWHAPTARQRSPAGGPCRLTSTARGSAGRSPGASRTHRPKPLPGCHIGREVQGGEGREGVCMPHAGKSRARQREARPALPPAIASALATQLQAHAKPSCGPTNSARTCQRRLPAPPSRPRAPLPPPPPPPPVAQSPRTLPPVM